jgi:pimeloyl-ACP methyl ester carboxylesterase
LTELEVGDFTEITVVQTAATYQHYRDNVVPGLEIADAEALDRIRKNWALTIAPESGPVYTRPTLILCGRQDSVTGYDDQYLLLPHYPRATYAVLDMAGHNLQIEQPDLLAALFREWLGRVSREAA